MTLLHDIRIDEQRIEDLCRVNGIARLWLFGSIVRDDFGADSDVDVLVELREPIGLFCLGGLRSELEGIFGRPVHLTTLGSVPDSVRPELLEGAKLQHGQ